MRLIDADALHAQIQQDYDLFKGSTYLPDKARRDELSNVIAHIINAPIVEAELVRCGKWEITNAYPHNVYCSACHKKFAQAHWAVWEDGSLPRNYCPNCGAKMAGPIWRWKNETN